MTFRNFQRSYALAGLACAWLACGSVHAGIISTGSVEPSLSGAGSLELGGGTRVAVRVAYSTVPSAPARTGALRAEGGSTLRSSTATNSELHVGTGIGNRGSVDITGAGSLALASEGNAALFGNLGGVGQLTIDGPGSSFSLRGACSSRCGTIGLVTDAATSTVSSVTYGISSLALGAVNATGTATVSAGAQLTLDSGTGGTALNSVSVLSIGVTVDGYPLGLIGYSAIAGAPSAGVLNVRGAGTRVDITGDKAELNIAQLIEPAAGLPREVRDEVVTGALNVSDGAQVTLSSPHGHARSIVTNSTGTSATINIQGEGSRFDAGQLFVAGYRVLQPAGGTLAGGVVQPESAGNGRITLDAGGVLRADTIRLGRDFLVTGDGGVLEGNVENAGTISSGHSPGVLNVLGDLALLPSSRLVFEIGGTTAGDQYDVLNVTGAFSLGGALEIVYLGGFVPAEDDVFKLFDAGSFLGQFDQIILPAGETRSFNLASGSFFASVPVMGVPAPTGLLLLGPALLALLLRDIASRLLGQAAISGHLPAAADCRG